MKKYYIEYLRIIALIGVITTHVTSFYYTKYYKLEAFDWWIANILNAASRFAAPMFVMISGAVIIRNSIDTTNFYKKRFSRLVPPTIFWTFVYIGLLIYGGTDFMSVLKLILVSGRAYYHLWYLSMFICLMIFVPFICKMVLGEKLDRRDFIILGIIIFAFFFFNNITNIAKIIYNKDIYWFKTFPWFIGYFVIGYLCDKYFLKIRIKTKTLICIVIMVISVGSLLNYYAIALSGVVNDWVILNNTGILVLVIAISIFLIAKNNESRIVKNNVITSLSEASFGIYLIHPLFLIYLRKILPNYDSFGSIYIPLTIFLTITFSYFSVALLRKNALLKKIC